MRRRVLLLAAAAAGSLAVLLAPLTAATPRDYAAAAFTILPPGENGSLSFDRNTTDQAKLYDALTPLFDKVTQKDIARYFKPARFGLGGKKARGRRAPPRGGVKIVRDRFDVPHVNGKTRAGRRLRRRLGDGRGPRPPARADPRAGAGSRRSTFPGSTRSRSRSPAAASCRARRRRRSSPRRSTPLQATGPLGGSSLADVDAFVAGLNALLPARRPASRSKPWTPQRRDRGRGR